MLHILLLAEVALHKARHIGNAPRARVPAKNLQVHARKMVVRVRVELRLKLRQRLHLDLRRSAGWISSARYEFRTRAAPRKAPSTRRTQIDPTPRSTDPRKPESPTPAATPKPPDT